MTHGSDEAYSGFKFALNTHVVEISSGQQGTIIDSRKTQPWELGGLRCVYKVRWSCTALASWLFEDELAAVSDHA
jgi:hypothetical protein